MQPVEVIVVGSKKISCDGNKGASSHPLVYLNMGAADNIICPYCSRYFTTKKSTGDFIKTDNKTNNLNSNHS
ncbi:MAG: zinc-finger domain-containing protein [Pseudomonadota bacterium]